MDHLTLSSMCVVDSAFGRRELGAGDEDDGPPLDPPRAGGGVGDGLDPVRRRFDRPRVGDNLVDAVRHRIQGNGG